MKQQNTLQLISADKLRPHPDNPRKNLGDLSELTESIKANGILQNLTVVPDPERTGAEEGYLIVIGHRRNAAGLAAGLDQFPCVVRDLSHADQVKMMLCENIQRNELTPLEQAQGFQMMMDLGATVEQLSKDTGFAQSTIYHRLNIAKLNKKTLTNKMDQLTVTDLIELEKIDDIEMRNEILKDADSRDDLRRRARNAYEGQERAKISRIIREKCIAAGLKEKKANTWDKGIGEYESQYIRSDTDPEKLQFRKNGIAFTHFSINEYGNFLLYTLKKDEQKPVKNEKEVQRDRIEKQIKKLYGDINGKAHQITESLRLFIEEVELHERAFDPKALAAFLTETLLFLAIEQPYTYRFPTLDLKEKGVEDVYKYTTKGEDGYSKHYDDARNALTDGLEVCTIKCAGLFLIGMAEYATDVEKITNSCNEWSWRSGKVFRSDKIYQFRSVINIAAKLGFTLDDDQELLLQGKGELFEKIAELAKEYESLSE